MAEKTTTAHSNQPLENPADGGVLFSKTPDVFQIVLPLPPRIDKYFYLKNGGIRKIKAAGHEYEDRIREYLTQLRKEHGILRPIALPVDVDIKIHMNRGQQGNHIEDHAKVVCRLLIRMDIIQYPRLMRKLSTEFIPYNYTEANPRCEITVRRYGD